MASNYTFSVKPTPLDPLVESNFNSMSTDGNHQAMTGVQGSGIQTTDATASAQKSPLTVTDSSVVTINVPLSAVAFNVMTTTNTLNISEVSGMASYCTIPTGEVFAFPCTRESTFYLESNTGNATVSFWFTMV